MQLEDTTPEFSFPVDVMALPPSGKTYMLEASAEERARVAERLNLQQLHSLAAVLEIKPASGGIIKVTGEIRAKVVQSCVVSLAPVEAVVSDTVEASFMTEERIARDKAKAEKALTKKSAARKSKKADEEEELLLSVAEKDPPEVALGGRIDLGEVAVVHLALALDPYPRAPGAAFDAKAWGVDPEKEPEAPAASPFAALAQLKKPGSKGT